jgi:hypothetical protein
MFQPPHVSSSLKLSARKHSVAVWGIIRGVVWRSLPWSRRCVETATKKVVLGKLATPLRAEPSGIRMPGNADDHSWAARVPAALDGRLGEGIRCRLRPAGLGQRLPDRCPGSGELLRGLHAGHRVSGGLRPPADGAGGRDGEGAARANRRAGREYGRGRAVALKRSSDVPSVRHFAGHLAMLGTEGSRRPKSSTPRSAAPATGAFHLA